MKPKKILFLIVFLTFLFIANFVLFSIIQRPLYADECNYQECNPRQCRWEAWDECDWMCRQSGGCEDVELEDTYCAIYEGCECFSLWTLICENETEFYHNCHEIQTIDCPPWGK